MLCAPQKNIPGIKRDQKTKTHTYLVPFLYNKRKNDLPKSYEKGHSIESI